MIVVVSAGSNDQSNRTPREVFDPVLASRSIMQIVEAREIGASGRLGNVRGRRTFTSDRKAEAALGLQELLQGLVNQTRGHYDRIFAASGYPISLDRLQRRWNRPWAKPLMRVLLAAGALAPRYSLDLIFVARRRG